MPNLNIIQVGKHLFLLLILQLLSVVNADGTMCNQVFNFDAYFSLSLLSSSTRLSYKIYPNVQSQGNFTYNYTGGTFQNVLTDPNFNKLGYDVVFNFCSTVNYLSNETSLCGPQIDALQNAYAMMIPLQDANGGYGTCSTISPTFLTSNSKFDLYDFSLIDSDKPQTGFIYNQYLPSSRIISTTNPDGTTSQVVQNYNNSMTYVIYCDTAQSGFNIQGWQYINNSTYFGMFFQATSKYGCPTLQLSKLWQILSDNSIIFTIVMVIIGAALCFFGLKIYNPTLFIVGYITGFGGIVAIMGEFVIRYDSESVMAYACLIIAVIFGVLMGYVTVSMPKLGFFALGMWMGVVLALLFNNAFLYKIQVGNQFVVLWVTIAVLATIMGLLSFFFYKHCVMICTGFVGSYCLIRPFGWILGDFPNELQIAQELKYGQITSVPNLFYLYFALIIIVGIIGIKFQYSMYFSRRQNEEENDLQLYLADPDFMDLNKSLLDKDDEDLTTKEKAIKKKLVRMQKNVEKEKQRQDKFMKRAEKLKRREKGEDVSSDSEEDEDEDEDHDDNSDNSDEEKGRKSKTRSRSKSKSQDLGLFNAISKNDSRRKSRTKSNIKKQNSNSSNEEDDDHKYQKTNDRIIEKPEKENKKFSSMFAGIKKNKKLDEDDEDHGIEMDDMSDAGHQETKTQSKKVEKQPEKAESNSDSEKSKSDSEEDEKQKKKNAKNAAKLAKQQKKKK